MAKPDITVDFKVKASCGAARAGLAFGGAVATPACMLVSRDAAIPHLGPAQLAGLIDSVNATASGPVAAGTSAAAASQQLVHICALDIWDKPGADVFAKAAAKNRAANDGAVVAAAANDSRESTLGRFCGLGSAGSNLVFLSASRPHIWSFGGRVADDHVCGSTSRGMTKLTPQAYGALLAAAAPHACDALSDQLPASCIKVARAAKAVDRTLAWLDQLLAAAADGGPLTGTAVFGVLQVRGKRPCAPCNSGGEGDA
jgi:hypothetical protein